MLNIKIMIFDTPPYDIYSVVLSRSGHLPNTDHFIHFIFIK